MLEFVVGFVLGVGVGAVGIVVLAISQLRRATRRG